ncbi:MAG: AsmA family protein [Candidatus Omnitrophica bacterium]|nr:AsmA family protein [Candidatus Omnitrophota bacterium]
MSGRKISLTLIFVPILILLALVGGLWFALASKINPEAIQRMVISSLEEKTEGTVDFEGFRFSYFPIPKVEFQKVQFEGRDFKRVVAKAEKIKITFQILPLLFRKIDTSKVEVQGGEISFLMPGYFLSRADISNIILSVRSVGAKTPMAVEFKGDLAGMKKTISGRANVMLESLAEITWNQTQTDGFIQIHDIDLKTAIPASENFLWKVDSGNAAADFHFKKIKDNPKLILESNIALKKFVYQTGTGANLLTSPPMDLAASSELEWNPEEEGIDLKMARLESPMGKIEGSGRFLGRTKEFQEVRLRAPALLLETIPQYWIFLKEAIPFNLGFSGQSSLEMSLEGTLDHLSLHANMDFTKALLTYGRFFSKERDIPLGLGLDYLIKDGKLLSGDFSLKFLEARIKGTVTGFDLRTGGGSINVITNKFPLAGWQSMIPPFADYELGGEMKILANMTGHYQNLSSIVPVFNVTLENGKIARTSTGQGITDLNVLLDYGPVALEIKELKFQLNGSALQGGLMIYNPATHPEAKAKLESSHLEPSKMISGFEELFGIYFKPDFQKDFDRAKKALFYLFPDGHAAQDFSASLSYTDKDKKLSLEKMNFEAYRGTAALRGSMEWAGETPEWLLETEINRLNLSRFLTRQSQKETIMEGNLFLNANFYGKDFQKENWYDFVAGEGSFSVTNGSFESLDLLAGPASLEPLKGLASRTSGQTKFNDLRGQFTLKEGKFSTEKIMMISRDLVAEGHGELYLDGLVNYRLDMYLSPALTDEVVAPLLEKSEAGDNKRFGPLPFLLSGPLAHPELKPDPVLIPQVLDQLAKRRTQKIFRHFLPEDLFFERRKSS